MDSINNELLFAEERKNEIVKIVKLNEKTTVPKLVEHFKVSPATIRNDLRELESLGFIKRTHGGAIPISSLKAGFELDNSHKIIKNYEYKQQIAKAADKLIDDGDIIILDTGTTTLELAKLLAKRSNITIIINDIEIARVLEDSDNQILLIGGSLRKKFHCTVGPFATTMLSGINVDKIFLGTNSFSLQKGCTTPDIHQAEIKKIMIEISNRVHLLCDSSKFGINSFVQFSLIDEIDVLITDQGVDPDIVEHLSNTGMNVIVAPS